MKPTWLKFEKTLNGKAMKVMPSSSPTSIRVLPQSHMDPFQKNPGAILRSTDSIDCPMCKMNLPKVYPVPVKMEDGTKGWFMMPERQYKELAKHV